MRHSARISPVCLFLTGRLMLFAALCGCLAGVALAFAGRSGSCSRRIDITISSRRSFLPASLPSLSYRRCSFLFTFLAPLPYHFLFLPRLLLSSSSTLLRRSSCSCSSTPLLFVAFPFIFIGPYPPHTPGVYFRGTPDCHSCSVLYILSPLCVLYIYKYLAYSYI